MSDHTHIDANGLSFAYLSWGTSAGPLALLIHGFPDGPSTWRHLGPALAEDGFRVVAPWSRGYAPTTVPSDRLTGINTLAADLNALHDALGGDEHAVLVGHDWGAMAAYRAAASAPERWSRVVTLSVASEPALARAPRSLRQLRRSWYVLFFQLPGSPQALAARKGALVRRLWRSWSPGYPATDDDLAMPLASLTDPAGAGAVLSYYRALVHGIITGRIYRPDSPVPSQPTLFLQGAADGAVGPEYADGVGDVLAAGSDTELLEGLGHWPHLEDPDGVNRRIRTFLTLPA